jgi:putative DNA primase/helicase
MAILGWMIEGCLAWQRQGLNPPAAVREATASYMDAEDIVATWLSECCSRDPNAWESSTELFGSWSMWARGAGETIGSQKSFVQKLEKGRGLTPKRNSDGRGFQGVRINPATAFHGYSDMER